MSDSSIDLEDFGKLSILDENSVSITIKQFWQENPAILIFIRHFG